MQVTAQELCRLFNGTLEGDPDVVISKPSKIENGEQGSISFIAHPKYAPYAYTTEASALLIGHDLQFNKPVKPTLIRVDDVYSCVSLLLEQFVEILHKGQGVDPDATVHPEAELGKDVTVGAYSIVSQNASIGSGTIIYPQVFVGEEVEIGRNVTLYPGVKIYRDCKIGDNSVIHANTVIGSDGFGFAPQKDGSFRKVPQIGNVLIGDEVEIGANCVIDRATMGSTIIQDGVKLDNLVQVAHNVDIGKNTVIAAQTGVAGSSKIDQNSMIGGQVGIVGHIEIAPGTKIQAQSGVARSVKERNTAISGSPAFDYHKELKSQAVFRILPDLLKRIQELEKKVNDLED